MVTLYFAVPPKPLFTVTKHLQTVVVAQSVVLCFSVSKKKKNNRKCQKFPEGQYVSNSDQNRLILVHLEANGLLKVHFLTGLHFDVR